MSGRYVSRISSNEEEQSSSSFRIPYPNTVNMTTHAEFAAIPSVSSILNNHGGYTFVNERNNCVPNNNNNDHRNLLFPADRFNQPLLQPNVAPYLNLINNDPRIQPASTILSSPLRQHNSMGFNMNGAAFDRFIQPLSAPQGTYAINPPSLPMINFAPVTPSIPAAGNTSLPLVPTSNPGPSVSSLIPSPSVNDQSSCRYLLSFEQQVKIAHEAAKHYANLAECLMEHARNAAAAENMPPPSLPQAVFSMVQKYDQKDSLQRQEKREEENKDLHATQNSMVLASHPDAVINRDSLEQQQISFGALGQKRSPSFTSTFSEPVIKHRHTDSGSNTETTAFCRSESDSDMNKTVAEILPVLSPHPYYEAPPEEQQNEMDVDESRRKSITETVNQPLRAIQESFSEKNPRYETETNHSCNVFHSSLTPSERFTSETTILTLENTSRNAADLTSTSQYQLDSGISMGANSMDKRKQIPCIKPLSSTSFTVSNILVENDERNETNVVDHVREPTTTVSNQISVPNPQVITKLPTMPPSSVLGYPVPQQTAQNCINEVMQTPGSSTSTIHGPFRSLQGYAIAANGILITPDGRAVPPPVYNCFGIPGQPIAPVNSNHDDENLCAICGDKSSGNHYSVPSCEGCKGFFRRTIQKKIEYVCYKQGHCVVDQKNRNRCQCCRFKKCLQLGMRQESVRLDRNRRKKKDESREKELEEIEEMKKLKATVVSAYREAFPSGKIISNREEALERTHVFLNNIPTIKEINDKDREKVIENGIFAALALRTSFTIENYESIIGVRREALMRCVNGLGFDVKEEEMAILTAFCSLQNCTGIIENEKIQNIGAKLCNCLRVHLMTFCDGINEIICKCIMSVTALMLLQTNTYDI